MKSINSKKIYDVIVIGAGITGAMTMRELARYNLDILCLEKENDVGNGASSSNSAILHSGYDPVPGTLKAKFNVEGSKLYPKILEELDVPHDYIGSLTVAFNNEDAKTLKMLLKRAKENKVEVKLLNKEETLKLEPNLNSDLVSSLYAPSAGIVNPFLLVVRAMENALDNGGELHLNEKVEQISRSGEFHFVKTNLDTYQCKFVINCAGLHSDEIHALIEPIAYHLTPRKGEYYVIDHEVSPFVKHTIFPVPSEKGKGILISPTTSGNYIIGPSSEEINQKDDVSTDPITLAEVKQSALKMCKVIPFGNVIRVYAGDRPTPSTHDFIVDFAKNDDHFINVSGIESPGLVSAPAIAKYLVSNLLASKLKLTLKANFNPKVRKHLILKSLPVSERNEIIKKDPRFGEIICDCEKVSLGEILDEFNRSVPPRSVKAVKKRLRAGFGKCQGGFCQSRVIKILANQLKINLSDVLFDKNTSNILKYETKVGSDK